MEGKSGIMNWSMDIVRWQRQTFGMPTSATARGRVTEELDELDKKLNDNNSAAVEIVEEIADVVITLCALAAVYGHDLETAIERKMLKNRSRKWRSTGQGVGQHVEEQGALMGAVSRCSVFDNATIQCEFAEGHKGAHGCPQALARLERQQDDERAGRQVIGELLADVEDEDPGEVKHSLTGCYGKGFD